MLQTLSKKGFYIIAEIGVNYYEVAEAMDIGPQEAALAMIDAANAAGADAVKFQAYKAENLCSKDAPAYWDTDKTQYEHFLQYDGFGRDEYQELADHCFNSGIDFMCTGFDADTVDMIDPMVSAHKIPSCEITNWALVRHIALKGKPVLLSTGGADSDDIRQAQGLILGAGNRNLYHMHCVLSYPTKPENANLNVISYMPLLELQYQKGYSDHVEANDGMAACTMAHILGAKIIEKHFTLDKGLSGNDHSHSMDPDDLRVLVANLELVQKLGGSSTKQPLECERDAIDHARRNPETGLRS